LIIFAVHKLGSVLAHVLPWLIGLKSD